MSVNTTLSGLSQTAASNGPDGSVDPPSTVDDAIRYALSFIASLRDGKGFATPVVLASASTTDIGAQNSLGVEISGTTTITSFGTTYNGPRFLRFTGALTLTHNASNLILPGGANITTAAGDCAVVIPKTTAGTADGWQVISFQRGGAAASFGSTGVARNMRAILTSNGTTVTFAADDVIVSTALNGLSQRLASFSKVLDISTTGAGGMDTGAAPTTGFLAIYAIAKTDGTQSILGVNAATSTGSIYSGANMPSGYTYSALIAIWPTNATPQLLAGMVDESRWFFYQTAKLITGPAVGPSSLTSQSISTAAPVAAKSAMMVFAETSTAANAQFGVAADSTGTGLQLFHGATDGATRTQPSGIVASSWNATAKTPLIAAQTVYWFAIGGGNEYLYCTGYSF